MTIERTPLLINRKKQKNSNNKKAEVTWTDNLERVLRKFNPHEAYIESADKLVGMDGRKGRGWSFYKGRKITKSYTRKKVVEGHDCQLP